MTQPRAKRIRRKRQRPVRCAQPTPERKAWVIAEIKRRLGVFDPNPPPPFAPPAGDRN
ncbi:MAG: hypothetical protein J7515_01325 [Caulobacter sp.]|nr:hypothetical protein [Caulobacter sp.]